VLLLLLVFILISNIVSISEASFEGTIGTRFTITGSAFGIKKPKVYIEYQQRSDRVIKVYGKVERTSDTSITCLWTKSLPAGTHSLWAQPADRGSAPIFIDTFSIKNPIIDNITPDTLAPGATTIIDGQFFTNKKPKVYLMDLSTRKKKNCRVLSSNMDPSTGASSLEFVVPKLGSGPYKIILQTQVGETFFSLTSISGEVTDASTGLGISGVTIVLDDSETITASTGDDGTYLLANIQNGSHTLTPYKEEYMFFPKNISVTINNTSIIGQKFTGNACFSISGRVTGSSAGIGIAGVTMTLSGSGIGSSTTTNGDGVYSFTGVQNGSYIITLSKSRYTFSPQNLTVTVNNSHVAGQDFAGSHISIISGRVTQMTTLGETVVAGVMMTLSGSGLGSATTNGNGVYSFTGVPNGNYIITPSKSRYTFSPQNLTVTVNNADVAEVDFVAVPEPPPSGPINPPPAELWQPLSGSTPSSGNYVYLQSDPGDYIGVGQTYTYTQADASISVSEEDDLSVIIHGDQYWRGIFQAMSALSFLQPGYYGDLERYMSDSLVGGLDWSGEGRGCNQLTGWFVIDNVTYVNGVLTAIDIRFEQHCEGMSPALHGQIHWTSDDPTTPPGPVNPPPDGLWQPEPGSTPSSGNYVYLQSDRGDYSGGGRTYTYTKADAYISVGSTDGHLSVYIDGDEEWSGRFQTMSTLNLLQPGYYGNLERYPGNPAEGGLEWSGGWGCNTLTGWFVIDSITYIDGVLSAIDLRFEQHCEGMSPALHGQIHWTSDDPTTPPGPVNPPPDGLWLPEPGSTPSVGNYVFVQSDAGDYVGAGRTYSYTQANARMTISATGGHLSVVIGGDQNWHGDFHTMSTLNLFQPGYYGDLERFPFGNPTKGTLVWSGEGRGCNQLIGWFVIDNVIYVNGILTAIDVRFEQHCEGATPALHGQIHWTKP
jgi:hypothetical protein